MKLIALTTMCLTLFQVSLSGQCPHDPTITPNNLIMCPNGVDTLWTQEYDAYEWHKDGNPISGANEQFLVVDFFNYVGSSISVNATDSGCAEFSPAVLVDGWAFLLPFVITTGDYTFNGAAYEVCLGDTIFFELGLPYNTNIEWTANGVPINGETDQVLALTSDVTTGVVNYNVCGSPSECPEYVDCLGVTLSVQFVDCDVTSVEEVASELNIYPNPMNQVFYVECGVEMIGKGYTLIDQLGKIVQSGNLTSTRNVIVLDEWPSGLYHFNLIGSNQSLRVLKE